MFWLLWFSSFCSTSWFALAVFVLAPGGNNKATGDNGKARGRQWLSHRRQHPSYQKAMPKLVGLARDGRTVPHPLGDLRIEESNLKDLSRSCWTVEPHSLSMLGQHSIDNRIGAVLRCSEITTKKLVHAQLSIPCAIPWRIPLVHLCHW